MPWYKLEVSHGPGHQSGGVSYHFSYEEMTDKVEFREWYERLTEEFDWPIGTLKPVSRLPEDEIKWKIKKYEGRIKGAKKAIAELKAMKKEYKEEDKK